MGHDQRTTTTDGTTIAWSRRGTGSPVLLVHGITESAGSFGPVTDLLAATHEVITMDLRGHGESSAGPRYDLDAMADDVLAVFRDADVAPVHLVGHSLGGAVVSAAGARTDVASVVDIDQSLQLASFKELLTPAERLLRDPAAFDVVLDTMFESMSGTMLSDAERTRIAGSRRATQSVVLGVWDVILSESVDTIAGVVDAALAGYATNRTPYLALFGIDPGPDYPTWLADRVPGGVVEVWADHGHYPHLVDPVRFVSALEAFWRP